MATERIVFFYLDHYIYGLDVDVTKGIERQMDYIPVPNSLPHIKGLLNLRGDVIPVYSLRTKLGLPEQQRGANTQMIIGALKNGMLLALEVDDMKEIIEVEKENFSATPAMLNGGDTGYISRVAHLKDGLAIIINLEGMLTEEEKGNIQKFIDSTKEQDEQPEEETEETDVEA